MAMRGPAHISGDSKPCANCGTLIIRKRGQNGTNWTGRNFCSVQCANFAKRHEAPPRDLVGETFGRWNVTAYHGRVRGRHHAWSCVCECGTIGTIEDSSLKAGKSKSCGCATREAAARTGATIRTTHGRSKSAPEYYVWSSMKQRCLNSKVRNWEDYGGRGITVCDRWRDSFEAFYADMGPRQSPDHSIDRIDNDGNYEPGNCQWRLRKDQVRNRRSNVIVVVGGEPVVLSDAARNAGVKFTTALSRYRKGWPINRVLEPVK